MIKGHASVGWQWSPLRFSDGDSFVAFDTEWTAWEGSMARNWSAPGEYCELVQIGAVKLDTATLTEIESLELIVRPRINPVLSDYFINLTGVTQDRVDAEGMDLVEAMERFAAFMGHRGWAASNGGDDDIIRQNAELIEVPYPLGAATFLNLRAVFIDRTGFARHELVTSHLDRTLGFDCADDLSAHDALADARKLAGAIRHLRGCDLL